MRLIDVVLPAPFGAEQRHQLARADREVDALQRLDLTEALAGRAELDHGSHGTQSIAEAIQFRGGPGSCIFAGTDDSSYSRPKGARAMADLNIWMNGKLVPPAQAVLPVNSAAVFYATNVFEGLRAYWNAADDEVYSFRLPEHFQRFRESMKMMRFTIPYSDLDLYEAVRRVLSGNEVREDIHMHMCAYVTGTGLNATTPTGIYINPRRRPRVAEGSGLRCCVSSWVRTSDNAIPDPPEVRRQLPERPAGDACRRMPTATTSRSS